MMILLPKFLLLPSTSTPPGIAKAARKLQPMLRTIRPLHNYTSQVVSAPPFSQSPYSYIGRGTPTVGIRRETINAWERRVPLSPNHVKALTRKGIRVFIQPSNRRAFPIQDYIGAGAIVQEDLSQAQLILSVKQVPVEELIPNKTYAFFSHTIKAQPDNMEMLDTILHRKIRLIDFEKMVDADDKRLVYFGKWAGYTGFIDILHGLGLRLLALGHHTPFIHIALAHNYSDSHMAINAVRDCGYEIALNRMPRSIGPLIFVFTGTGNVSQGAQELFRHFPHEFVDPSTLPQVAKKGQLNKVYGCVVSRSDHMIRKGGGVYNKEEFEQHPERYVSKFASEIAPFATVILNCVFWGVNTPRLITIPEAKFLLTPTVNKSLEIPGCPSLPHRLMAICDISADPGGSIEFMRECTTIDKPFVIYDADLNQCTDSFDAPSGCLVCSIDNMPAQLPVEASEQFGSLLLPYVIDLLNCSTDQKFHGLQCRDEVKQAIITSDGELTPNFKYIEKLRTEQKHSAHKSRAMTFTSKRVLLLGAGMVSDPLAKYFASHPNIALTVASESSRDGQRLAKLGDNIESVVVDVNKEPERVNELISKHELCISLLPYTFHPQIVRMCIRNRTNMVTSSYISPELQALDEQSKSAGITVMNESGLDPGIDHMLAMECIDKIHSYGGKVTSFVSFAGGLPAPEVSENALRYKFSWSPKGVLMALLNPARYLMNGKVVELEGNGKVLDEIYPINFMPGFNLIGFANRDSTKYAGIYGVENECRTLLMRGTLRYEGFIETVKALKAIGYLSTEPKDFLNPVQGPDLSWKQITASLLNQQADIFPDSLKNIVTELLGREKARELEALEEIGLFSEALPERLMTPLDTLVPHLAKALAYAPGERDLIILNHDIEAQLPSGAMERHRINMVAYGEQPDGFSAMARTVGYTTAIISHMILDGEIQEHGMLRPTSKAVYRPALQRLHDLGIKAVVNVKQYQP